MIRDRIKNLRLSADEAGTFDEVASALGVPVSVLIRALVADAADRVLGSTGSAQTPEGRRIIGDIHNGRKA